MNTPVEEVRLSLPHIELAAHLFGPEDGLPVIALHGWLDNANSFARLAPKLEGLRIVALDMAGHGHSAHRPTGAGYALWDYVYDVLQVAEQLGWKRFALLGHSLGAIVSLVLAGALPERVTHLGLIDGVIPPTATGEDPAVVCPPHRTYHVAMAPPMAADATGRPEPTIDELLGASSGSGAPKTRATPPNRPMRASAAQTALAPGRRQRVRIRASVSPSSKADNPCAAKRERSSAQASTAGAITDRLAASARPGAYLA